MRTRCRRPCGHRCKRELFDAITVGHPAVIGAKRLVLGDVPTHQRDDMVSGEEPELFLSLRCKGWYFHRLDRKKRCMMWP